MPAVGGDLEVGPSAPGASGSTTAASLLIRRGPGAGSRFILKGDTTVIGRHGDCDLRLDDVTVSRRHAVIERSADRYVLRDLGSLNGTYVHLERIGETPLRHGDELRIGRYELVFLQR